MNTITPPNPTPHLKAWGEQGWLLHYGWSHNDVTVTTRQSWNGRNLRIGKGSLPVTTHPICEWGGNPKRARRTQSRRYSELHISLVGGEWALCLLYV